MSTMDTIILIAGLVVLTGALLVLVRALLGRTLYDRILAANVTGTKTVIFLALLGFMGGEPAVIRPGFLDIALLYALVNYVATVAILKFVARKRLG